MKRRDVLRALAALPATWLLAAHGADGAVQVFKNADCGCCTEWVKHLQAAGFTVRVTQVSDTGAIRKRFGMPERFGSCHTATADGYVLEGHVPARDIARMLQQRPAALGLAVPGMPAGSPGMEIGERRQAFDVLLVDRAGNATAYAHYPAA
jgi:hypothetical protein